MDEPKLTCKVIARYDFEFDTADEELIVAEADRLCRARHPYTHQGLDSYDLGDAMGEYLRMAEEDRVRLYVAHGHEFRLEITRNIDAFDWAGLEPAHSRIELEEEQRRLLASIQDLVSSDDFDTADLVHLANKMLHNDECIDRD